MDYRLDIDGLRAIAVSIVIGFHLDLAAFSGGHVGVDVFFVLSGFLITSIIYGQIKKSSFSLVDFYLKRVCRIFPALYVTVFFTFIAAYFILYPDDFERFSLSAVATVLSFSNFVFWSESGYWDVSSTSKALLHTWSLGVEEQFYLIWPAVMIGLFKINKTSAKVFFAISVAAVALSITYSTADLSGAFYLLPARIFQFSLGAFLAVFIYKKSESDLIFIKTFREVILLIGLILLSWSTFYLDDQILYPGLYALIPTTGAAFIILSGSSYSGQGHIGRLLLENKLSIWVGRISYSLYLVHWPVIVFYRYLTNYEITVLEVLFLISLTIILGSLLHYFVEKKFYAHRFSNSGIISKENNTPKILTATISSALMLTLVSIHSWTNDGWAWRFDKEIYSADDVRDAIKSRLTDYSKACFTNKWSDEEKCRVKGRDTILFIGNSHEPDGFNFMSSGYPKKIHSSNVVNFGSINECRDLSPVEGKWKTTNINCQDRLTGLFNQDFISELDFIVYSAHHTFMYWNHRPWEMVRDIKKVNPKVEVIVIGDYLETKVPCVRITNMNGSSDSCFSSDNVAYEASNVEDQDLYKAYGPLIDLYIDQLDLLCTGSDFSTCKSKTDNGVLYSYDNHHKSLEFSAMAGKIYAKRNPSLFDK